MRGKHLISDTAKHRLQGHTRRLLADFGGLAAAPFSVCLPMLQNGPFVSSGQYGGDVRMPASYVEPERRSVHWVSFAQSPIKRIRVGHELGRRRIEQHRAAGSLNLPVHAFVLLDCGCSYLHMLLVANQNEPERRRFHAYAASFAMRFRSAGMFAFRYAFYSDVISSHQR